MFLYAKRTLAAFLGVVLCATAGCGGTNYSPPKAADPAVARQTLKTVLDAWKSGTPKDSLASQTPKVFVGDEDWSGGNALKDYKLIDDGESYGSNVRFRVGLELDSKGGTSLQKTVRYIVATDPVVSITRDDRTEY